MTEVKLLTAEEILASEDLPRALVHVLLWGGDVWVRAMTLGEQDMVREMSLGGTTMTGNVKGDIQIQDAGIKVRRIRSYTVALAAIKTDGSPLFTIDQAVALEKKSAAMTDLLFAKITSLTQMTQEEVAELEGESEAVPSGDSSTD